MFLTALALNVLAWKSSSFCDFYAESVFPVWSSISTRVMSVFPFSVGEGMIVLGILFLTAFAAVGFLRLTVKKAWSKKLFHSFSCTFSWIFLALVWVMTCNCFLLYHSSAFEDRYMEQVRSENYSKAELAVLRDYIVVNANELAEQMERDADGYLIYKGDMNQAAVEAMQQVGTVVRYSCGIGRTGGSGDVHKSITVISVDLPLIGYVRTGCSNFKRCCVSYCHKIGRAHV